MTEQTFHKFIPFAKVDAVKREVWGIVTAEVKDKGGETCDYESTVPYYKAWSEEFVKATEGKSVGNLRYMHQMRVVGKGVGIEFRDTDKEIWMGYKVTEDQAWKDVEESVLTGFSQGGRYVKGPDAAGRYTAAPSEVSLVDNPALGVCHFAFIRTDGAVEMRKVRSEPAAAETKGVIPPVTVKDPMAAGAALPALDIAALVRSTVTEWLNKGVPPAGALAPVKVRPVPAPAAAPSIALLKSALAQVHKGMYDVAQFAGLIESLAWLQRMAEFERENEGDESTVPSELMALLGQLCQTFLAMADEETKELIARPSAAAPGQDLFFATNSTVKKASALLTKAAANIQIQRKAGSPAKEDSITMSELSKKAGLTEHLNKAKEMASEHNDKMQTQIDKCVKCLGGGDEDAAKAALTELAKTAATAPATGAEALTSVLADFQKTANESADAAIAAMMAKFATFMDNLSKTLEPPKAAQTDLATRVVSKVADGADAKRPDAAGPAVPKFVPLNSAGAADPKVRDAMKAVRGAPLGE